MRVEHEFIGEFSSVDDETPFGFKYLNEIGLNNSYKSLLFSQDTKMENYHSSDYFVNAYCADIFIYNLGHRPDDISIEDYLEIILRRRQNQAYQNPDFILESGNIIQREIIKKRVKAKIEVTEAEASIIKSLTDEQIKGAIHQLKHRKYNGLSEGVNILLRKLEIISNG